MNNHHRYYSTLGLGNVVNMGKKEKDDDDDFY